MAAEARARVAGGAIVLAVLLGLLAGIGGFTFLYAEGLSYLSADPAGVRELPHHAAAVRRLAEGEPPHRRDLRRLPPAARLRPQVPREGGERLPPLKAFTLQDFHEPI